MAYIDNVTNILQIQPDGLPTFVRLSQNENGRNLYFQLVGNEADIPSNATVVIEGTKPDGTVYSGTGSISNNVVLIPEMIQMTAVAGYWDAKVKIVSGGNTVATGRIRFVIDADTVEPGSVPSDSVLNGLVAEAQQYAETARTEAYGSPLTATTAAGMTDKTRVYVYTGSESSYTAGHWYFWNGSAWADGGVYNAVAVNTDKTLTLPDIPADAKATGDAIGSIYASAYIENTASGSIASFSDGANNVPVKDLIVNIEPVQEGEGDPSPENIRPISGWTGAKVTRCGKNLMSPRLQTKTVKGVTFTVNEDKSVTISGTNSSRTTIGFPLFDSQNELNLPPGQAYYFGYLGDTDTVQLQLYLNGTYDCSSTGDMVQRTTPDNTTKSYIRIRVGGNETVNAHIYPMITTEPYTEYVPPVGDTYDITFPSETGTVYGGKLNVTTGELVVDRAQIASYNGETLPSTWISDRDVYIQGSAPTIGAQVVYKPATPITYQLTPTEVATFLGTNNIWADTGDVDVTYRADPKLYIEQLTKPSEDDMVANANIESGKFFMVGNNLYLSTAAIATGATIVPGTNCTAVSLAEALNNINA